jgi:zinc and cadmium transporter
MTLFYIVLATLAGGVMSVLVASLLNLKLLSRVVKSMVSLSAGILLGVSLLHVLPFCHLAVRLAVFLAA